MTGAAAAMGSAGGFLGTAGTALSTGAAIYNMVGPQSPLVTGNIGQLAGDVSAMGKGLSLFNTQPTTPSQPQVDAATMSKAQPSELAALPMDVRHQILAAMLKDIK